MVKAWNLGLVHPSVDANLDGPLTDQRGRVIAEEHVQVGA